MHRARRLPFELAPLAFATLLACARSPATIAGADASTPAEPPPPSTEPKVTPQDGVTVLVDAGTQPYAPLRYHPRVGDRVQWSMVMLMDTSITLLGTPQQSHFGIEIASITEVVEVDETAREHQYLTTFVDAKLLSEVTDPAAVDAALAPFIDLETWTRSSPLGESIEIRYSRKGEPVDPSTIKGLENPVATMLTFPEEPVGIGARWRRYDEIERNGFRVLQTSEHRLVRRDGDRLEIATTVTQAPLSSTMRSPKMAPTTRVELQRFDASGAGVSLCDLGLPIPVAVKLEVDLDMTAVILADTEQAEMALQMSVETRVNRAE